MYITYYSDLLKRNVTTEVVRETPKYYITGNRQWFRKATGWGTGKDNRDNIVKVVTGDIVIDYTKVNFMY